MNWTPVNRRPTMTAQPLAWLRNLVGLILSLLIVYGSLYFGYRATHTQAVGDEGDLYVIFGSETSYLLFAPATRVDAALTDMRFHVGPVPREP